MTAPHAHVVVVGAGFAGIAAAIRLRDAGFDDVELLERSGGVGGTWRQNTYPGCACDVPSNLYSLSFAPNPGWSRTYSPQPEIEDYLERLVVEHDLRRRIRFDCELLDAHWDATAQRWNLRTSQGPRTATVLVAATGPLNEPVLPDIRGLSDFPGRIVHTARWGDAGDLAGERVAVIGTGASSIQVVPHLQRTAAHVTVFQRTPPWVLPHTDRPTRPWERRLFGAVPAAQKFVRGATFASREVLALGMTVEPRLLGLLERLGRRHLAAQVPDPDLRARLTPDYRAGCKRILLSDTWYPALGQDNVSLVTDGIDRVEPDAIVTRDGVRVPVDTIVLGTGFHVTDPPIVDRVHGAAGTTLRDAWNGSPQAYLGTSVHGFPNLFLLVGPNTGLGHNSIVYMIESQVHHLVEALRTMREHGIASIDVRAQSQRRFNEAVQRRMRPTVWLTGGCSSWYLDEHGRNTTLWPSFSLSFRLATRRFRPSRYHAVRSVAPAE